LQNWELLFVDNGSTDKTADAMAGFARSDPRIKVFSEARRGAWAARNKGLDLARGECVFFLDADDYIPNRNVFINLYSSLKKFNTVIAGGSKVAVSQDGSENISFEGINEGLSFTTEGIVRYSSYQFDYGFYRFLYNREFLTQSGCFFPPYQRYEDPPFFVNAMLAAGQFVAIIQPTYAYRIGHQSVKWGVDEVHGLLMGLAQNLQISRQKGLHKLHRLTVERLACEYAGIIQNETASENTKIKKAESRCLSSINLSFLHHPQKKFLLEYYRRRDRQDGGD
jgi:glycosyltransferase involved in cell wall biosynthesis